MKPLLILLYPFALLAKAVNSVLGYDRLRLHEADRESFWIARRVQPGTISYFSEASVNEGGGTRSAGWLLTQSLLWLSRLYVPSRTASEKSYKASAERDHGIPDEVYTLW